MADPTRIAAGWYPDPSGLPQLRWWDGRIWTRHTSDAVAPTVPAVQPHFDSADTAPAPVVEGADPARFSGGDGGSAALRHDRRAEPENRAGAPQPRPLDSVFDAAFTASGAGDAAAEPETVAAVDPEPTRPGTPAAPTELPATARLHLAFDEHFGRPGGDRPAR